MREFDPIWDTRFESPDGTHTVHLTYTNEIPWGESYYHMPLDETSFGERIFTDECA